MRPALVALLLLALPGCGDDGGDEDGGAAGTPSSTSSSSTATTAPPTTAAPEGEEPLGVPARGPVVSPDFPDSSSPFALLTEVRAAAQPGFDRVVFELDGPVPAFEVRSVDEALADGSGDVVDVRGEALLQVILTPASGVDLLGAEPVEVYTGPARFEPADTTLVEEVVRTGDFEGQLRWVIGLRREVVYSVTELEDPGRLVIDLVAPGSG